MQRSRPEKIRAVHAIGRPPKAVVEKNSSAFPNLSNQWHTERNDGLSFDDVAHYSPERVWWKCPVADDHVWQASVVQRTRTNSGCPFCLKQRPSSTNNLALIFPEVCKEVHPDLNGDFDPTKISPRSSDKIWWKCKKDPSHVWQAAIGNRTGKNPRGCPICSGKLVTPKTSLMGVNPKLASEWHPTRNDGLLPNSVAPNARKKVWWRCSSNPEHEWDAWIYSRSTGIGCPFCSNRTTDEKNTIVATHPELLMEWDYARNVAIDPKDFVSGAGRAVWWRCKVDPEHRWKARIINRAKAGTGCPICRSSTSAPEIRLFAEIKYLFPSARTRHRINGVEADIYIPDYRIAVEYDGSYFHRAKGDNDLKKNIILEEQGVKLLRVRHAPLERIASHDVIVTSDDLTKSDLDQVVYWISRQINSPSLSERYQAEENFVAESVFRKYLSYLPAPFPENAIPEKKPELVKEWNFERNFPLEPKNFTPQSHRTVWWRCSKEARHEWQASIKDRAQGNGCPFCSGRRFHRSNSLSERYPDIAVEWHPEKNGANSAKDFSARSIKKVWWQCKTNSEHNWLAPIGDRVDGGGRCPFCAGRLADNSNHLEKTHPYIADQWHPTKNGTLKPEDVTPGMNKLVWWQCSKDSSHDWEAIIYNRTKAGSGECPYCNSKRIGINNNLKVTHPEIAAEWHSLKNGTLVPEDFVAGTAKKVWWKCPNGVDHEWRTEIRGRVNSKGCPFCSGRLACSDRNLAIDHPELADEWCEELNGDNRPNEFASGSTFRAWWRCSKNPVHVWDAQIYKRAVNGRGCPQCARSKPRGQNRAPSDDVSRS